MLTFTPSRSSNIVPDQLSDLLRSIQLVVVVVWSESSYLSRDFEESFVNGHGLENVGVGDEDGVELEAASERRRKRVRLGGFGRQKTHRGGEERRLTR